GGRHSAGITGVRPCRGLPFGLADPCIPFPPERGVPTSRAAPVLMSERAAQAVVRFRWLIVALWTVIGAAGLIRAPGTAELLSVRGGADRETDAARADRLLTSRFARPFSEFFAVAIESPAPFTDGLPAAMLDSITDELKRE